MALTRRANADGTTTYTARIYVGDGKRVNVVLGSEERKARAAYEDLMVRYRRHEWRPVTDIRVNTLARQWLVDYLPIAYRKTTQGSYASIISRVWLPLLSSRRVTTVTAGEIETWIAARQRDGWSTSRIRAAVLCLSSLMTYALDRGHLYANPIHKVALPAASTSKARYLSAEGLAVLLEGARRCGPLEYAVIALGATVGLRKGEVLGLGMEQVLDLYTDSARLVVERSSYRRQVSFAVKTPSSQAVVPLGSTARAALETWMLARPDVDTDVVFCRHDGRALRDAWVNDALKRSLRMMGVDESAVDYHGLRHSVASLLAVNGTPLRIAQSMMRHHPSSGGGVTAAVYQHTTDGHLRIAAEAVDAAIRNAAEMDGPL